MYQLDRYIRLSSPATISISLPDNLHIASAMEALILDSPHTVVIPTISPI